MSESEVQQQKEEKEEENLKEPTAEGNKRKLEDTIDFERAKLKVQEIASRLVNDADSKRPRLGSDSPSPVAPTYPVPFVPQQSQYGVGLTKKISIPNGKVGVVIGKGGETIKYIQLQSGAKIQITRDLESDPHALTRDVELTGTSQQIDRAEQLINDVIAEADAGGPASPAATNQLGAAQFSMKVPNDKVGLLIGKGGETIKYMQSKTGARMQIIPLHLPPGDPSTERTVYINGSTEQIEAAKELVNDVVSGKRIINPSAPGNYVQSGYGMQQPQYPYTQQPQYGYGQMPPSSYYGNYSTQQTAWDQSNPSNYSQPQQQTAGYGYYGQQPQMGSAPYNANYGYGQTPVASTTYDQSYTNQQPSYGQNISGQAPSSTYGAASTVSQPDGSTSQAPQVAPAYPPLAYSQPQTYWSTSTYNGQPPPETGYDQTAYAQGAYGQVPPYATQPIYGQTGYPDQSNSAPPSYAQGTQPQTYEHPPAETKTQSQSLDNGLSQSSANATENHDENANSASQEAVPSQS